MGQATALLKAVTASALLSAAAPALAQTSPDAMMDALAEARAELDRQREALAAQETRLKALEDELRRVQQAQSTPPTAAPRSAPEETAAATPVPVDPVGEAPSEVLMPTVAVLGMQGDVLTQAGRLTAEAQVEYARSDRNRAIFRGIEVVESVLVGVFDINENRSDALTAALSLRYGLSGRLEVGGRVPYLYRTDATVLAPVAGSTPNDTAATRSSSVNGDGIGDVELFARYQLTSARPGLPFLIGALQAVAPTGSDPFGIPRDANGLPLRAATGSGFWGLTPSLTVILPNDPAVLFGSLGYTHNFAKSVNTRVGDIVIDRVEPGDALSGSAGIGVSLNNRTSFNLGYAHTWVFGSRTSTRLFTPTPASVPTTMTSRDLQLGRLLLGVTYRATDTLSLNWTVEAGVTDDATDVRTVLRVPIVVF